MAEDEFNVTIGESEYDRIHVALYEPTNSTIYISLSNLPNTLHPEATNEVMSELKRKKKEDKYEDFLLVAVLAEEAAHFVEHTRGLLPTTILAQPSKTPDLQIKVLGTELGAERRTLIGEVFGKVYEIMDYDGNPPRELVLTTGKLTTHNPGQIEERKTYLDLAAEGGKHSEIYDYEIRARDVQSQVLEWWFKEKEQMDSWFDLGKR